MQGGPSLVRPFLAVFFGLFRIAGTHWDADCSGQISMPDHRNLLVGLSSGYFKGLEIGLLRPSVKGSCVKVKAIDIDANAKKASLHRQRCRRPVPRCPRNEPTIVAQVNATKP